MELTNSKKNVYTGIGLAIITVIIWSGNYVVARGVAHKLPAISLAFYRWMLASICMLPLAIKKYIGERRIVLQHKAYIFWTAFTGIAIFNTFIYLAGHYTSAINLALIGTTAAPVFITFLSAIFLKEMAGIYRITGMLTCMIGVIVLLSQGSVQKLAAFRFGKGDVLVIISALAFSIYSILVKRRPAELSPLVFLFTIFTTGTLIIVPFFLYQALQPTAPVVWDMNMILTIVYVGIGNSVIGFFGWNAAIEKLGAAATALFANLIPVFSTIEAVLFLNEKFTAIHLISGLLVIGGVVIANLPVKTVKAV